MHSIALAVKKDLVLRPWYMMDPMRIELHGNAAYLQVQPATMHYAMKKVKADLHPAKSEYR